MIDVLEMIKDLESVKADPSSIDSVILQYRLYAELLEAEMDARADEDVNSKRWDFEQFGNKKVDSVRK